MREIDIEETLSSIEMRLKCLDESTAILTADNLLFKIELSESKVTATFLMEFDDELDPIMFINKMIYQGK